MVSLKELITYGMKYNGKHLGVNLVLLHLPHVLLTLCVIYVMALICQTFDEVFGV